VQIERQGMSKRLIAANDLLEQTLLYFARQIGPETKRTAANHLRKPSVLAQGIPLAAGGWFIGCSRGTDGRLINQLGASPPSR
jgi:hypothetical protein